MASPIPPILLDFVAGDGGTVIHGEESPDQAGWSVASAGDLNGDGFDDLIIGARYAQGAQNEVPRAGAAYVVFGSAAGLPAAIPLFDFPTGNAVQGFMLEGTDSGQELGWSVASAGDINGDGLADLVIGAPVEGTNSSYGQIPKTYVVFGQASGFAASSAVDTLANGSRGFVINGEAEGDQAGLSVASAGDVNGDGFDDLIIGAPQATYELHGREMAGMAYVVFGKGSAFSASVNLSAIAAGNGGFAIAGEDTIDFAGFSVASAGDVNGDGFDDLVIGGYGGDGETNDLLTAAGDAYVLFGKASGFSLVDLQKLAKTGTGKAGFAIRGAASGDYAGWSVHSAGDFNGDGFDDVLIGAPYGNGNGENDDGDTYVVFGKATGFGKSIDLATFAGGNGSSGFVIRGETGSLEESGFSVSSAGDVNGDGFDDLIIGAPRGDGQGEQNYDIGKSYVIFGRASGIGSELDLADIAAGNGGFVILGADQQGEQSGNAVSSAGDVNGDGFDDLLVGVFEGNGYSNDNASAGDTYVIYGKDFSGAVTDLGTDADETLTGGTGADIMVGGQGDDSLVGAGGLDVMRGGSGDDVLSIGAVTFQDIDGGSGIDTLALAGSMLALDLTKLGRSKLSGVEVIDLTGSGNNSLKLSGLQVVGLGTSNQFNAGSQWADLGSAVAKRQLEVTGNKGDKLTWGDANKWTFGGSATDAATGKTFSVMNHSSKAAQVLVDSGVSLIVTGTAAADTLAGGLGADTLSGKTGKDKLTGGAGIDFFRFDTLPDAKNVDSITDFEGAGQTGGDVIQLSRTIFNVLPKGALASAAFETGTDNVANGANTRLVYNKSTGALFYDDDGSAGSFVPVQIVTLVGSPDNLSAGDFKII